MPYTMDDHHLDALRFPACMAGCVWKQRGNVTGHCARCHETFEGIKLFDAHQKILDSGQVECRHPSTLESDGRPLRLEDGSWRRDIEMPESGVEAFRKGKG